MREVHLESGEVVRSSGEQVIFADILRTIRLDAPRTTVLAAAGVLLMLGLVLRRARPIALVGAALAAAPGCGSSGDDTSDTGDAEDVRDTADDADAPVDTGADADADADDAVDLDSWEVVDPPPAPMCADVPAYTLSTRNLTSELEKATAEVSLTGTVRPFPFRKRRSPSMGPPSLRMAAGWWY